MASSDFEPPITFANTYVAPDDTIQRAHDMGVVALQNATPQRSPVSPVRPENGDVQVRYIDTRALKVAQALADKKLSLLHYDDDGSVIVQNYPGQYKNMTKR